MAVDKLVDSTQLDADLTSVANAIRTKGGTSASLAFPTGFVSAIDAIPTGGGGGTTIDTAGDYTINAGDTITMGTGLTGALTASGQRVLTNSWDFKTGLVDSVGGLTATLGNSPTRDSSGVRIASTTQFISIPVKLAANKTYEIDITSLSKTFSSGHGRLFMWSSGDGIIAQNGSTWKQYASGAWAADSAGSNLSVFNGKTLRICTYPFSVYASGNTIPYAKLEYFIDGVKWYCPNNPEKLSVVAASMTIGASANSFATMIITGFRIYNGTNV
jgi:hypothetical protein